MLNKHLLLLLTLTNPLKLLPHFFLCLGRMKITMMGYPVH